MFRLVIGRGNQADVRPDSLLVSRRHAELTHEDDGWHLTDLNSDNGTYVNGVRIQTCFLRKGDTVGFADALYVFDGIELVPAEAASAEELAKSSRNSMLGMPVWAASLIGALIVVAALVFVIPLVTGESQSLYEPPKDMQQFLADVKKSSVTVTCEGWGQGSGFAIDWTGSSSASTTIITNFHVIEGCVDSGVIMVKGSGFEARGRLIDYSDNFHQDLAAIEIRREVTPLKRAERVGQGNWVLAYGTPAGQDEFATTGEIVKILDSSASFAAYGYTNDDYGQWVLHNARINHGNSGGPLVNSLGQLVGVNTLDMSYADLVGIGGANGWPNICATVYSCDSPRTWRLAN